MPRSVRSVLPQLVLLLPALLLACATEEGSPGVEYYEGEYALVEVTFTPSILSPGDTGQAHLIALDEDGAPLGELATDWTPVDTASATVNASGLVVAHAEGLLILHSTLEPERGSALFYVSPPSACGDALTIGDWTLSGSFAWVDDANSGDTAVVTHHTTSWNLSATTPRQVNGGEVVWRVVSPGPGSGSTWSRTDTLTLGATKFRDHGGFAPGTAGVVIGETRLTFAGCKLAVQLWPNSSFSTAKIRPGLADSVTSTGVLREQVSSAQVAVGSVTSSAPIVLSGMIPTVLPTDADLPLGYGPGGYAAFVSVWKATPDSVALTLTATPIFEVPSVTRGPR